MAAIQQLGSLTKTMQEKLMMLLARQLHDGGPA
jgi:hypothetical protein